ncbi:DUF4350 domain-containing protein [Candidatus Aerophobetes bacterium]|nr:DUF4350 domain-containing protein [Candidatus Aerophobetes bacterium]
MKKALISGCLVGVVAVIFLMRFYPPTDDFNLENPFWNGLKNFQEVTEATSVNLASEVRVTFFPAESILFIIGPSGPFGNEEVALVKSYLEAGGGLVLADDFGSGNFLLEGLGLRSRFSGKLVVDALFRGKASCLPKTVDISHFLANISALLLNYPTFLEIAPGEASVLATSSAFSYVEELANGNMEKRPGPFPMIAEISYGKGKIYLVADASIFINCMLDEEDNRKLAASFVEGKQVFIDTSTYPYSRLGRLKAWQMEIYHVASRFEVRYSIFLALVLFIVGMRFKRKKIKDKENIRDILERHPDWNKTTLLKIKKERKDE